MSLRKQHRHASPRPGIQGGDTNHAAAILDDCGECQPVLARAKNCDFLLTLWAQEGSLSSHGRKDTEALDRSKVSLQPLASTSHTLPLARKRRLD